MKDETTKEIVIARYIKEETAINGFIENAIANSLPVETMERLFALRKEVKAEYAKEEFQKAMSAFQKDCLVIEKTKSVMEKGGGAVRYKYAPLDEIVSQVKKPLGDNDLSYDFTIEDIMEGEKASIKVTCTVTHVLGHSKSSSFKIPIGAEAYMTDQQKHGARVTFAKRYAFCNALGILTGDEDTDAKGEDKKPISLPTNTKVAILHQLKELGADCSSKEMIEIEIKRLTNLDAIGNEEHLKEISSRLSALISEKSEAK